MPHDTSHKQGTTPAASRRRKRAVEAFAALLFALNAAPSTAVELGEIRVHSWLGKQIKASIPLFGDDAGGTEARCFKGVLVNLHGEPVSALKLGLQQTTAGSVLLLFGGSAVDEPAATVVVENICGAGGSREYAVLLDLVPASQAATAPAAPSPAVAAEAANAPAAHKDAAAGRNDNERIWIPDTIYPIPGMPPMRMASMLGAQDGALIRRVNLRGPSREDISSSAHLRLDPAYDKFGLVRHGSSGTSAAWITGALSALLLLGAAAWIVYRVRAMRAAAKPWLPIDERIDAGMHERKPS